ncbi:MAG TPA: metalloprotease PmbA [Gammaproteobacteria bacterium]
MSTLAKQKQFDTERLTRLAELALNEAKRQGMDQAEVGVSNSSGLSVTVRLGDIETLEHYRDQSLGLTVYKDKRKGSASTSDLSETAVREAVRAACSIAGFTAQDEYAGLADAALMARNIPDLDLYHVWELQADKAIELAQACEGAARDVDKQISNSEGATVVAFGAANLYANTHGFIGGYSGTRHSISCSVIAGEGEHMQRDYWYTTDRNPQKLQAPDAVGREAAKRALRRLNARKIPTAQLPVLFVPEMARGLLGNFVSAIRGGALYRKASFLLDHKGKPVFPEFIDLVEQPHLPGALGSAPFDNEGVATREHAIVSKGVLQDYVLDAYSARRLGTQTTGNAGGVHNLSINSTGQDQQGLIKQMERGLLVTEMMGHGVNNVTGDYSRGASGFWVENGEVQYPVQEITIAGTLKKMFMGIVGVGNDIDVRGNIRCGSILVDSMTVAGD